MDGFLHGGAGGGFDVRSEATNVATRGDHDGFLNIIQHPFKKFGSTDRANFVDEACMTVVFVSNKRGLKSRYFEEGLAYRVDHEGRFATVPELREWVNCSFQGPTVGGSAEQYANLSHSPQRAIRRPRSGSGYDLLQEWTQGLYPTLWRARGVRRVWQLGRERVRRHRQRRGGRQSKSV